MKRKIAILLLIVVFGCAGCTNDGINSNRFKLSNTSEGRMIETENGYYVVEMSNDERLFFQIYYADKTDLTNWVLLCNKPNCTHGYGRPCNGNIGNSDIIQMLGDKIYSYSSANIVRMDLTGENHESVRSMKPDGFGQWNIRYIWSGDNVFMSFARYEGEPSEMTEDSPWVSRLILLDPNSEEKDKIIFEEVRNGESVDFGEAKVHHYQTKSLDKTYFVQYITNQMAVGREVAGYWEYDPQTGELIAPENETCAAIIGNIGDKTYYLEPGVGITDGENVLISVDDEKSYGGVVHDYLFICDVETENPQEGLTFYDTNGKKIGSMFYEERTYTDAVEIYGYSDDHIFIRIRDRSVWEDGIEYELYAVDAKALAEGKIEYVLCYSMHHETN